MRLLRSLLLAACGMHAAAAQQNLMYADFEVDDGGPVPRYFTVLLDHFDPPAAPQAVASFIGLATGSRFWVDSVTGEVRNDPFYDGTTLHFVSPNGRIAFGSRDGSGTDDPGWVIPDDFRSNPNDSFSVYLENDGLPNNNGSRIFITIFPIPTHSAQPVYTRLGRVETLTNPPGQAGRINVQDLSFAQAGPDGRPLSPITINSVTIRRVGLAEGFDETGWLLPVVDSSEYSVVHDGGTVRLRWSDTTGTAGKFYGSSDLVNWEGPSTLYNPPGTLGVDLGPQLPFVPRAFYRGTRTTYLQWGSAEVPLPNAIAQFTFIDPQTLENVTLRLEFDGAGTGGDWFRFRAGTSILRASGSFTDVDYTIQNPYRASLSFTNDSAYPNSNFLLHFDYEAPFLKSTSRFSGGEDNGDGMPGNDRIFSGLWSYLAPP